MISREPLLDAIKGFAIFLVVLGHAISVCIPNYSSNLLFMLIYSFHMPLFMAASGYLCYGKIKNTWQFIRKRSIALGLPYISFTIIFFLVLGNTDLMMIWFLPTLLFGLAGLALFKANLQHSLEALILWEIIAIFDYAFALSIFWYFLFILAGYILAANKAKIKFTKGHALMLFLLVLPLLYCRTLLETGTILFFWYKFIVAITCIAISVYLVWLANKTFLFRPLQAMGRMSIHIYLIHIMLLEFVIYSGWLAVIASTPLLLVASMLLGEVLSKSRFLRLVLFGKSQ